MQISPVILLALTDPSAAIPSWAPFAFGAIILVTLVVVIVQAVRYLRDNRDDD